MYPTCRTDGVWRSLVARPLWERKVVGSNPATPTTITFVMSARSHCGPRHACGYYASCASVTFSAGRDPLKRTTATQQNTKKSAPRRPNREERRGDPEPDPGSAHCRGALRGAQA